MCGSYFAYNGWQMHWPVLGWRRRLGVCLHWLISQTKRVSRPTSCVGSDQTAGRSCRGSGKGPCPPGKTRWALSVTASITSLWTNELFTERGHLKSSVVLVTVTEMKSSTECKNQMLYSVLSCEKASLFVFTTVFSLLVSETWRRIYIKPFVDFTRTQKITWVIVKQTKQSRRRFEISLMKVLLY